MKEVLKVTSVLCGLMAIVTVIFGVRVMTGHGTYVGLAMFSMARQGTAMGFIGNILGIAVTALGFGMMAYMGLTYKKGNGTGKKAFVWGAVMSALCLVSLVCSIIGRTFNFGDVILLILPVAYTYAAIESA